MERLTNEHEYTNYFCGRYHLKQLCEQKSANYRRV